MAKKKTQIPKYGTITLKGIQYYRTRITDADGKELSLYAATCEELYEKQLEARKQVEEIIFHRQHPTVAEYGEKWLLMQSAKVSASTLRGYTRDMTNYIIKPLGEMYMEEVTADDIRLALVPLWYPPLFCCAHQRHLQDSFSQTATIKFIWILK